MTVYDELALQFAKFPQVTQSQTGQVTIGRVTYPCIRYTELCQNQPGTRAYSEGKRDYTREFIYCVGLLPAVKRNGNVAFRIHGDSRDWYIASYYPAYKGRDKQVVDHDSKFAEFHPQGATFMLAPWDISESTIDQHARVHYKRVNAILGQHWVCRKKPAEVA